MGGTWKVEVTYEFVGPQANGLSATPEGLWVCDQADDNIYLIEYRQRQGGDCVPQPRPQPERHGRRRRLRLRRP